MLTETKQQPLLLIVIGVMINMCIVTLCANNMTETHKAIDESIAILNSNNGTALLCSQETDFLCLQT